MVPICFVEDILDPHRGRPGIIHRLVGISQRGLSRVYKNRQRPSSFDGKASRTFSGGWGPLSARICRSSLSYWMGLLTHHHFVPRFAVRTTAPRRSECHSPSVQDPVQYFKVLISPAPQPPDWSLHSCGNGPHDTAPAYKSNARRPELDHAQQFWHSVGDGNASSSGNYFGLPVQGVSELSVAYKRSYFLFGNRGSLAFLLCWVSKLETCKIKSRVLNSYRSDVDTVFCPSY